VLLSVFTRHSADCKFARDRNCRRCNCPKWVGGQVNGYYFRQSAKTRQWAEAEEVRLQLEEALIQGTSPFGTAVTGSATPIPTPADPPQASRTEVPEPRIQRPRPRVTVAQAVDAYLADAVSRSVESSTLKKLETIFRKQFLGWTRVQGIEYLDEVDLDILLNFRNTWEDGPLAKQKKQSRVIGFFWACVRRRYLTENPAIGLGKIKVVQVPTDYFPPDEFDRIIAATYIRRGDRGGGDIKANQARLRTMTLLMRWSGLRIRDAVTLERHRLHGESLLLLCPTRQR
jgi:integrase/recombinase XerD